MNLLNLGLKCAPRKSMNRFDVYIDTHKFICTLNMKKFFLSHPINTSNRTAAPTGRVDSGLRNKSIFNPQISNNQYIEVFKNLVLKDIEDLPLKKRVNPDYIRDGIKSLEERCDIIIRPADKGGGVVVMDKSFYHNQLLVLLGDQTTYKKLRSDPTDLYK